MQQGRDEGRDFSFLPEAQEVLWVLQSVIDPQDDELEDCTGNNHLEQQMLMI